MKKINFKIKHPKINLNFSKQMPYILVGIFLLTGVFVLVFGYVLFKRAPDAAVKTAASQEIDSLSIHMSIGKMDRLFDAGYNTDNIKNPGYATKNPFAGF